MVAVVCTFFQVQGKVIKDFAILACNLLANVRGSVVKCKKEKGPERVRAPELGRTKELN